MVDAGDGDAHEFGGEHPDHSDSAGGGDVDDIGAVAFGGSEHLEHWRDGEVEGVVSGHRTRIEGGEVFDVGEVLEMVWEGEAGGGEDGEVVVCAVRGGGGVLDEAADAVDVDEGVGELEDSGRRVHGGEGMRRSESERIKNPASGGSTRGVRGLYPVTQLLGTATRCGTTGWRGPLGLR